MSFTPQPSIAWEEVETSLADWAKDMTGLEVAWAEEDGPQPTAPYVSLEWLTPPSNPGGDDYYHDEVNADDELERTLNGNRRGVLTVRVESNSTRGGSNANYYVDLLLNSLNEEEVIAKYFTANNAAVWDWNQIAPGDFARDKKAVSRSGADIVIGFGAGVGVPSVVGGYIKAVAITGTVSTPEHDYEQALEVNDEEA